MARWKLMAPHYLRVVEKIEWEYSETDRKTGRPIRKRFEVPRYLDTREPGDWTNKWGNKDDMEGEIVVCLPGQGQSGDIEFLGDATPDMLPLDDEARAITAGFEDRWRYRPESSPGDYSQSLIDKFEEQLAEVETRAVAPVQVEGLSELVAAIAMQAKGTQDLLAAMSVRRL